MRALHVANTFDQGGIASSLWHLLPALEQEAGVRVTAAGLYELGRYGEKLAEIGLETQTLGLGHKYDPRGVSRLARLIGQGGYDIVHAHGWPSVLFVALASFFCRGPAYFLSEHNVSNRRRRLGLKALDRFIYRRYQHVVAVSHAAAEALVAWLPETAGKVTVLHNSINRGQLPSTASTAIKRPRELRPEAGRPLILVAGSLEHRKGIDVFLEAFARLPAGGSNGEPVALIYGDGPLRAELLEQAGRLGIDGRVRFVGFVPELPALMTGADLFVLSSRWEGCPMVVLEAMAMGLPIVATAVGGVPELIVDGCHGILVAGEDPDGLSRAMEAMLVDRDRARRLGERARARLEEEFQAGESAQLLAGLYE